jgi:hypothetical protein
MSQEAIESPAKRRGDLTCYPLDGLSWTEQDCEASLTKVFTHTRRDAIEAIEWYSLARRPKRRLATTARLVAVLLIGAAALLPMLEGILATDINAIWISLAIAAAAGAIGLDRALGSSTGWIRCIKTELQLRDALEKFELEWECARAHRRGRCPTSEETIAMLLTAKEFAQHINIIIQEETNAWVDEFQSTINQIDEKLRSRREESARVEEKRLAAAQTVVVRPLSAMSTMPQPLMAAGFQANEWKDAVEEGLL